MESDLIALLRTDAAILALVSAASINGGEHPQGAPFPAIVVHMVNDRPEYVLSDTTDFASARVQIDCWALTYSRAEAVSRAVWDRLSGHNDAVFYRVWINGVRATRDTGHQAKPWGRQMDFSIDYRAA